MNKKEQNEYRANKRFRSPEESKGGLDRYSVQDSILFQGINGDKS